MANRFALLDDDLAVPARADSAEEDDPRPSYAQTLPRWVPWRLPTAFSGTLHYGVEGARITDPFYRSSDERVQLAGGPSHRAGGMHLGIDVSLSNASGGGADDPRRGLPVYCSLRATIPLSELNAVRVMTTSPSTGLGLQGSGDATLASALVHVQPWAQPDNAYGGVLGLGCRYTYTGAGGAATDLFLYVEWLHLITDRYLPKDGQGHVISADQWAATHKGIGFGPLMQQGQTLTAAQLTSDPPPLIGYLGATEFPHCHIQAAVARSARETPSRPRFDPAVVVA